MFMMHLKETTVFALVSFVMVSADFTPSALVPAEIGCVRSSIPAGAAADVFNTCFLPVLSSPSRRLHGFVRR